MGQGMGKTSTRLDAHNMCGHRNKLRRADTQLPAPVPAPPAGPATHTRPPATPPTSRLGRLPPYLQDGPPRDEGDGVLPFPRVADDNALLEGL